jgi:hypothetical protein
MGNDLGAYIQRLELMAFFAGYPLIYSIIQLIAGKQRAFLNRLARLLPFAYALTGTLFLGLVLGNIFQDYHLKNIGDQFQVPYLTIWGLLSVLFWIPAFSKKPVFSLLHSLVFFFLLLKDFFLYMTSSTGRDVIKNDMKIYTDSLLLNMCTLAVIVIIHFIFSRIRNNKRPYSN